MNPGDVVLIRFPQADLQVGKLRPVLVIAIAPGRHPDILLALITSRISQATPSFDEIIERADADFTPSGLKTRSVVRLSRLVTVEAAVISARLGRLSRSRMAQIRQRLASWLLQ
jgi:mRNA interferase MazF